MFKFLKSLFSGIPDYVPNPSATPAQKWALACSAVLTEINGDQHEWLHGGPPDKQSPEHVKAMLATAWGIEDRSSLLETLGWLESEGHRGEYERIRALFKQKGEFKQDATELIRDEPWAQGMDAEEVVSFRNKATGMLDFWKGHSSLLGWDLGRAIWLCRWGALVGFLSEEEAWLRIQSYAARLRKGFGSWAELGENYRAGFNFWSDDDDDSEVADAIKLLQNPEYANSPWALNRWA